MTELPCEIVQDLLPSYVDELTSPVTNEAVRSHLETCPACRESWRRMSEKPVIQTESARELAFRVRKRVRRRRVRLLVGSVLILLILLALFAPWPTHIQREYRGVWQDSRGEAPVTAALDYWKLDFLLLEDRYSGELDVVTETETVQFELEGELTAGGADRLYHIWTFTWFKTGYGLTLANGRGDWTLDRLWLDTLDDRQLKLVTEGHAVDEVDEAFIQDYVVNWIDDPAFEVEITPND